MIKKTNKKIAAMLISIAMVVSMIPSVAFATDEEAVTETTTEEAVTEETTEAASDEVTAEETTETPFVEGELLVVYKKDKINEEIIDEAAEEVGTAVENTEELTADTMQVEVSSDADVDEMIAELEANPQVDYVQRNFEYELMDNATNDASIDEQYYLNEWDPLFNDYCGANVINAWDAVKTNKAVTVAIVDSGVNATHEDLKDNILKSYAKDVVKDTAAGTISDTVGHGTHVAGIVAAAANNGVGVAGTSYNANIIPINVINGSTTTTSYLLKAYEYLDSLIESGKVTNLHVINMSLGVHSDMTLKDYSLEEAIAKMRYRHNVISVCAGGNDAVSTYVIPGDYDECLSVTALDQYGNNASYSDYNKYKDISAPGNSIYSTWNPDVDYVYYDENGKKQVLKNQHYVLKQGTSMATPVVSGIMALLWTANPDLTVDQAIEAVKTTAHPVNTRQNDTTGKTGSAGAIDAAAAVEYVKNLADDPEATADEKYIGDETIKLSGTSFAYTGEPIEPEVSIGKLVEDIDYSVSYRNNTKAGAGTGLVVVQGLGKYGGTVTYKFTITMPVNGIKLSAYSYTYNGNARKPAVYVTVNQNGETRYAGKEITESNQYVDLSYSSGRKNVGTYTVTATGKGYCSGKMSATFKINPKGTTIKTPTKGQKYVTVKWAKQSAKMSTSRITGYQVQIAKDKNFTKSKKSYTVKGYTKTYKKITKLSRKTQYYVRVRTYMSVGGKYYYSSWSTVKSAKTK